MSTDIMNEEIVRKRKESFLKTEMLTSLPQGWKLIQGAMTQPRGCIWVSNNKSRFKRDKDGNRIRKETLLIIDEELYKTSKHYKEKLLLQMR